MGELIDAAQRFPSPGSHIARSNGCTCPAIDNRHGRGYRPYVQGKAPPSWVYVLGCPIHKERGRTEFTQAPQRADR